jgi:ribosome-binding factor A
MRYIYNIKREKITSLIKFNIENILQKICIKFNTLLISVSYVDINTDCSIATVYISFFPEKNKYLMLYKIREKSNFYRKVLGLKIKNKIRRIPILNFRLDQY